MSLVNQMELMGRGGCAGGGGGRGERGAGKNQRSNTKKYGCRFQRGVFLCKEKKPEQNHILLDTRVKSLLSGLKKEKKKLFRCETLVEYFVMYFGWFMRDPFSSQVHHPGFFFKRSQRSSLRNQLLLSQSSSRNQ